MAQQAAAAAAAYDPYYYSYQHVAAAPPQLDYISHYNYNTVLTATATTNNNNNGIIGNDRSDINTLFISGLPDDVKPREIHNLFCRRPGFDYSQLKYTGRGNQVVAFATFFDHHSAVAALQALDGVKFDPQSGSTLHVELARSNSRRKRKGNEPYLVIDKRTKQAAPDTHQASADDDDGGSESDEPSESDNPDSGKLSDPADKSAETIVDPEKVAAAPSLERLTKEGGQTCSTLFIANLGPNCTEDELKQTLSVYPGFSVLKLRARSGMPVAFADFEEIEQATNVMEALQGSLLPSSDRGGMHIEYARSKMRKH